MLCPCGLPTNYDQCCGRFIVANEIPQTPEELMRSRYSAYCQADMTYIMKTMLSPAADGFEPKSAEKWARESVWVKLEILKTTQKNDKGTVKFKAYYFLDGKLVTIHELSYFERQNGRWYYIDGKQF